MPDKYQCSVCEGVFDSTATNADALKEMEDLHGPLLPGEKADIVCDDCYKRFRKWFDNLTPTQREVMEEERKLDAEAGIKTPD